MLSLRLSEPGKAIIKQARLKHGWTADDERWLQAATEVAQPAPTIGWEKYWQSNAVGFSPSAATLRRFLQRRNVQIENFQALCTAIDVDWQMVAEWEVTDDDPAPICYGRRPTIAQLHNWLNDRQCRMVWLYGRAGMGKTTVARSVWQQAKSQFSHHAWYSLETAIAPAELINQLLFSLSQGVVVQGTLADLRNCLKQHRCLVVLDQWETLMTPDLDENYQNLLRAIGYGHQSTLLLISRQRLSSLLAQHLTPRYYELTGLTDTDDREFLIAEGLQGSELELQKFITIYNNPQIIKLMAERIRTIHAGSIATLVESGVSIYGNQDVSQIIRLEFRYLSVLEKAILYWLAIWRRPIDYLELRQSLPDIALAQLDDALYCLITQHSLIIKSAATEYKAEPVTLKEITNMLVEEIAREIRYLIEGRPEAMAKLMISHSLVVEDEVIQAEQMRRIVGEIVRLLQAKIPPPKLRQGIQQLKTQITTGYAEQNFTLLEQTFS
jgi:hypothetical protein